MYARNCARRKLLPLRRTQGTPRIAVGRQASAVAVASYATGQGIGFKSENNARAGKKYRQHVNPLSSKYMSLEIDSGMELEKFEAHDRMEKPFHIDVGSHNGVYLFGLAKLFPDTNFIGLEIQENRVQKCLRKMDKIKANDSDYDGSNLHFIHANVLSKNGSFRTFLQEFSKRNAVVQSMSILNPDPCFKRRQVKRRMINEDVLQFLVDGLQKDAIVYIQSDNEVTFDHLRDVFFSPLGTKHFRCVEPSDILNCQPQWYREGGKVTLLAEGEYINQSNEITTKYDCPPNYPSVTKLAPGSATKDKPDATKNIGQGASVVQICDGMNDSSGFLGIAPGRELHQMNPNDFSSSDGVVWRHVFIKS